MTPAARSLRLPPSATAGAPARGGVELRCGVCGYGIVVRVAPQRCPMCSSSLWEHASYSRRRDDDAVRS